MCFAKCDGASVESHLSTSCAFKSLNRPQHEILQIKFNGDVNVDKFGQVLAKIANVKELALENVERALARGEKLQVLVDKSEALSYSAHKFEKRSKHIRDVFWWRNARLWLLLAALVAVIGLVVTGFACRWNFEKCF